MKTYNHLPLLVECLRRWSSKPSLKEFTSAYFEPMAPHIGNVFDAHDLYSSLSEGEWKDYRAKTLSLDPEFEEARLQKCIRSVETLFGFPLQGSAILFGTLEGMDGYARFDGGMHQVFLGVDENHGPGTYLDVLLSHELTHVARESRPEVWRGLGLEPTMTNAQFTDSQPVIEHLMGEGFSCAVSEILTPQAKPWEYAYQTPESLAQVLANGPVIDRVIHTEIESAQGDYGNLYNPRRYGSRMPMFTHYVWAWQWAKSVIRDFGGGDPKRVVATCSKDFIDHALQFHLPGAVDAR